MLTNPDIDRLKAEITEARWRIASEQKRIRRKRREIRRLRWLDHPLRGWWREIKIEFLGN